MQNITLIEPLSMANLLVTGISVIGIVHVLQEKFTKSSLKKKSKVAYFSLRGALASLASVQIYVALLSSVTMPILLINICTAAIATITSKLFH